jgi:hypothetical protein
MREDVTIYFDGINGSWLWTLAKGKYQARGTSKTLEDAEDKAFEVADQLPNIGHIHTVYNPAKDVKLAEGKIKDSFVNLTDSQNN